MFDEDRMPTSLEVSLESIRRRAGDLTELGLDEQIATATARRNVYAAHQKPMAAEAMNRVVEVLVDVRSMRHEASREVEALISPVQILRPLTAEELAESTWPDEDPDAPC